ncbi:hypothetical protein GQ464_017520 [Rhodocaloribacter litoris]|uniref:hypothetical protein n=1 Tax=Rhodocaloribacter litoris TaxID=2558931 RepID=UPI00142100FA|nr:hypothetical protein [Rhodocaloribacter litoris]QXD15177.1 hypothetical protein GQ464_017520 [Rhodocaloribacter litoris]GIV60459.1 MAG: hypothetical protein KatS3mg043_1548 [Rhodothermaceae bacterium]
MKTGRTIGLALMLVLAGCNIETVGPEGPPGPPGNANVFTLTFTFSMADAVFNGPVASVQYEVPAITRSVVDEGAVLLFFREQGTWTAMPYTFAVESPDLPAVDYTISLGFGYDVQFLEVFYEASTEAAPLEDQPDRLMKAVVIDGFPAGKAPVDLTDYEAVRRYFGLPD